MYMYVCVFVLLVVPTWLGHTCSRGREQDGLLFVDAVPLVVPPDAPVPAAVEDEVVPDPWERLV